MKVRKSALKDSVSVRTRTGEGSYGDTFADALAVPCLIDETRRLVRDSNGQETVSEATLTIHPDAAGGDPMSVFTAESEVTIDDRVSRVITAKRLTLRGYTTAIEVTCA